MSLIKIISISTYNSLILLHNFVKSEIYTAEKQLKISKRLLPSRSQHIDALKNNHFDILVIGGGATGTGVALDAVTRG